MIRLPIIDPRPYQLPFFKAMDNGCNRSVKSWPRRGGKDITDFQFLVSQALRRVGTYYYYFPTLELAKKALWDNIVEFYSYGKQVAAGNMIDILCPPEIRSTKNNSDYFIKLVNGSIIKIGGTDNLNVVGMNGYGYVFSEWQSQKKEAFGYISPILQENGGWALFNGTMRGRNNHLYEDIIRTRSIGNWFSEWLKPEDTKEYYWVNEEEGINVNPELIGQLHHHTLRPYQNIQDLVEAGETSFSLARQEYLNDANSNVGGSYYSYELSSLENDGRVKHIDPFSDLVYTFWDLGGSRQEADSTAIVFAHVCPTSKRVSVVDYYENKGRLRGHYIDVLAEKRYKYGGHYLPHDAKRVSAWTSENTIDTARNVHGVEMRPVPKTNSVSDDIEIVRRGFKGVSIDANRCSLLIQHLNNYHETETTGKPCHKENCSICYGASHGADAFRTMMMAMFHGLVEPYIYEPVSVRSQPSYVDEAFCV
jgi:phage terminase large subunit